MRPSRIAHAACPTTSPRTVRTWAAALLALATACTPSDDATAPHDSSTAVEDTPAAAAALFTEVQDALGLVFTHRHGGTGDKHLIETMGAGGGLLDYDRDGWVDVYLVQSGPLPGTSPRSGSANRLFRNEKGRRFVDVTETAGVGDTGYGMGSCFGDYDNDGDEDIYVTNFGANRLYRNDGDGGFTDVTAQAGVGDERWGTSAAFADYDRDGDLDLYVVNYLKHSLDQAVRCGHRGINDYCHPDVYPGCPDVLYRNEGDGTFTDVTAQAGVLNAAADESKGLGVIWFDHDDDGDLDIYVANDSTANFLYRNDSDGTFTEIALEIGLGYNAMGETEASMGVDAGDYDWDGLPDVFVTHLSGETNTLYRNAEGAYDDQTDRARVGMASLRNVGFGTGFIDYDNDGWLDLFVANGHVLSEVERTRPGQGQTFAQANQLFRNDLSGGFRDVSAEAGPHFATRRVSRGAAFGDVDNDGDLDVLVTNNGDEAVLLRNLVGQDNAWVGFQLVGTRSNRSAVGARVELRFGEQLRRREVRSGTSYLSQNDPRLVFGLASGERPDAIGVRWPDGRNQKIDMSRVRFNAYNSLVEPGTDD